MSVGSSLKRPVAPPTQEESVRDALHFESVEELQRLSLLPGGFGRARGQAWPYLLGVISSEDIDTHAPSIEGLPFRDHNTSRFKSRTQSLDSSVSTGSEKPSTYLHESYSDEPLHSHDFSDDTDVSPHPDEHQVQLDTNRSFVLYPIVDSSVNHRKQLQEDLHEVILGVLRKRPALRYFQGYHDIVTVLLLTLPVDLVLPSAEKLSLHRLRDSMGNDLEPLVGQLRILKRLLCLVDPPYAKILERNSPLPYYALSNLLTLFAHDVPTLPLIQHVFDWLLCREPAASIWLAAAVILSRKEDVLALDREGEEAMGMIHAVLSALPPLSEDNSSSQSRRSSMDVTHISMESGVSPIVVDEIREETLDRDADSLGHGTSDQEPSQSSDPLMDSWILNSPSRTTSSVVESKADSDSVQADEITPDMGEESDPEMSGQTHPLPQLHPQSPSLSSSSRSFPGGFKPQPASPPLPLPTLLCHASDLLAAYPPSSPTLRLTDTFGSHSALRIDDLTLRTVLPSVPDDVAESYVGGDEVVLPLSQEEEEEESLPPRRSKKRESELKKIRNGQPIRIANGLVVRRQTVIASVVLLLGVAVALYGFSPGGKGGRNGSVKIGGGNVRYVAAWVGGLLGAGERLGIGL